MSPFLKKVDGVTQEALMLKEKIVSRSLFFRAPSFLPSSAVSVTLPGYSFLVREVIIGSINDVFSSIPQKCTEKEQKAPGTF